MIDNISISSAIKEAAKEELENDPSAKKIDELISAIDTKKSEIEDLNHELAKVKSRRHIDLRWRKSIDWCLEIDANNKFYFLKSAEGVYKCIAFKHKLDITADMKNKIATTLSGLFREKSIGRIMHEGNYHYGLKKFFKENLVELKDEYIGDLGKLKQITIKA